MSIESAPGESSNPKYNREVPANIEAFIDETVSHLPSEYRDIAGRGMAFTFYAGFERISVEPDWKPKDSSDTPQLFIPEGQPDDLGDFLVGIARNPASGITEAMRNAILSQAAQRTETKTE